MRNPDDAEGDSANAYGDMFDLAKHHTDIHTEAVKGSVSNDYTLARLQEKDRIGIADMTDNAYKMKAHFHTLAKKAWKTQEVPLGKGKDGHKIITIQRVPLTKEEQAQIEKMGDEAFNSIMIRCHMTAILNRNVPNNYLARNTLHTSDFQENDSDESPESDGKSILQKAKDIFRKRVEKAEKGED